MGTGLGVQKERVNTMVGMNDVLFVGFKGKNNSSSVLAEQLSPEHLLLTNSFAGLKRDIDSIHKEYDRIVMFGVDKTLTSSVRIEKVAFLDGEKKTSGLNVDKLADSMNVCGISAVISEDPTAYLCNAAYWHMLKKFSGRAVFIHIPTGKNLNDDLIVKMKRFFNN